MEPNGRQGWHDIFTVHMRLFMTLKMHEMNIWIEWISHNKWHCPYIRRIRFKSVWQHPPSRPIFLHTADFVCSREATLLFWPLTSLRCRKTSLSLEDLMHSRCILFYFQMVGISVFDDTNIWPSLSPTWLSSRARLWSPAHGQADPLRGEVLIRWESGRIGMELSDEEGKKHTHTHTHTHTHRVPNDQIHKPEHSHKNTSNIYDNVLGMDKHRHEQTHHEQGFMSLHIWNHTHTHTHTHTHVQADYLGAAVCGRTLGQWTSPLAVWQAEQTL